MPGPFKLPKPGTNLGPCQIECKHLDCAETIRQADSGCGFCLERIGFDAEFFFVGRWPDGKVKMAHARCQYKSEEGDL